jgi:hydroxyacylglutathione hydrolase
MSQVKVFDFSPFQENTYVVYEGEEALIIDPGCFEAAEREQLQAFLKQEALTPKRLINTHCHIDHIYGNAFVKNTFNLPLEIPPDEQQVLDTSDSLAMAFGAPPPESPKADQYIQEGDQIRLGDTILEVLSTPGHSPGHISLLNRSEGYILSADVLFQGGIGRTDLPGADYQTLIDTINNKLLPLGDDTIVYPGHGPSTTIGIERLQNPFLQG